MVASLVLVGALLVEARSVLFFHSVTPWSTPQRIHFCGRDYNLSLPVSAAAAKDVVGDVPFRQLTSGPLWQPVYGDPASTEKRDLGAPCAMMLYLREGNAYRSYSLSGGP